MRKKMLRWGIVLILAVVVVGVLAPIGRIALNLHRGEVAQRELLESLKARYPQVTIKSAYSYEHTRVYLRASGVDEPARQVEIRNWLAELKAARRMTVEIWLRFDDGGWEEPTSFKF